MFININGPPFNIWNATKYVRSWLFQYRSADNNRSKKVEPLEKYEYERKKKPLWDIL